MNQANPQPNDKAPFRRLSVGAADFMKFFAGAGIVGVFLAGYSYVNTFYDIFGLELHEIDIDYLETIEFVTPLLHSYTFVLGAIGTVALLALAISWSRYAFGNSGFYLSVAILFPALSSLAVYTGAEKAEADSLRIIKGEAGRIAYCRFRKGAKVLPELKDDFEVDTSNDRVIKLAETDKMMYLFILPGQPKKEVYHGESFAFHKSDLSHCRVSGTVGIISDQ